MNTATYAVPGALTKLEADVVTGAVRVLPGGARHASLRAACKEFGCAPRDLVLEAVSVPAQPGVSLRPALAYELRRRGIRHQPIAGEPKLTATVRTDRKTVEVPCALASFRAFRAALDDLAR